MWEALNNGILRERSVCLLGSEEEEYTHVPLEQYWAGSTQKGRRENLRSNATTLASPTALLPPGRAVAARNSLVEASTSCIIVCGE